ncbi:hypothetical protein KGO5_06231 [Sinorhizobium sp. KGO-5]|nr:hypothetical protein KGO5_06231 [Sinorhizobium sp. KGO-5]
MLGTLPKYLTSNVTNLILKKKLVIKWVNHVKNLVGISISQTLVQKLEVQLANHHNIFYVNLTNKLRVQY